MSDSEQKLSEGSNGDYLNNLTRPKFILLYYESNEIHTSQAKDTSIVELMIVIWEDI